LARERGKLVGRYGDGNHLSPTARVVSINGVPIVAWIYRGGHSVDRTLELISRVEIAKLLNLEDGAEVKVVIEETAEGSPGMPRRPPSEPGRQALPLGLQKALYDSVGEAAKAETAKYLCHIIGGMGSAQVVTGSGIGVKIGARYFVLTAAHVIKDSTLNELWLYHNESYSVNRVKPVHMNRRGGWSTSDPVDVAFIEIAEADVSKLGLEFLPIDRLSSNLDAAKESLVMVNGFPFENLERKGRSIYARALLYITLLEDESAWARSVDRATEIEIDYPENVKEIDASAPARLPNAPGMSGGGLWDCHPGPRGSIWSGRNIKLLGIVKTWSADGRKIWANRLECHFRLIAEDYPDLIPILRERIR
jgi:hypothetical protein